LSETTAVVLEGDGSKDAYSFLFFRRFIHQRKNFIGYSPGLGHFAKGDLKNAFFS